MPQIDHENVENFQVFVVFDELSVQLLRDFVMSSNKINNKTTKVQAMPNF